MRLGKLCFCTKIILTNFNIIGIQNCSFWAQIKDKSSWEVSSFSDLPYNHGKFKQTLAPFWPQVARVWFSFLWTCWRLNKLGTPKVGKLVQHHQHISNPLIEKLKVDAFFKPFSDLKSKSPFFSLDFGHTGQSWVLA